jgi:hypothetical protein
MTIFASPDAAEADRGVKTRGGIALVPRNGVNHNDDRAVIMAGTPPWRADYECSKTAGDRPLNQRTPIVFHPAPRRNKLFSPARPARRLKRNDLSTAGTYQAYAKE